MGSEMCIRDSSQYDGFSPSHPVPFLIDLPERARRFQPYPSPPRRLPSCRFRRNHGPLATQLRLNVLREPPVLGPPLYRRTATIFPRGLEDSSHSLHRVLVGLTSSTTSPTYPRYRPPPLPDHQDTSPLRFCAQPETLAEPSYCRYLRDIVSSLYKHRPSTSCLAMTPAREP